MQKDGSGKIQREIRSDMVEKYDIAIIGAGPAGSTFARLSPGNLRIALIDKRNLADSENFIREKCCGGLLAPAAQKELAEQGLGIPKELIEGPQTFSVKSMDYDNGLTRFYQRHYININREKFDRWLVSLVPENIDMLFGCISTAISPIDGGYSIYIKDGKVQRTIEARMIVAADGAASFVRSRVAPECKEPLRYVSIQDTYDCKMSLPFYFSIFERKTTDFYSWIIPKEDKILFGSAVPWGKDVIKKHEALAKKLFNEGVINGPVQRRSGAIVYRPSGNRGILLEKENVFFIGEASGLISPSSAEGISYAMKSGRLLAQSFESGNDIKKTYSKAMLPMRLNIFYKNIKSAIMYNRITRKIIMKSGIMSIQVKDN